MCFWKELLKIFTPVRSCLPLGYQSYSIIWDGHAKALLLESTGWRGQSSPRMGRSFSSGSRGRRIEVTYPALDQWALTCPKPSEDGNTHLSPWQRQESAQATLSSLLALKPFMKTFGIQFPKPCWGHSTVIFKRPATKGHSRRKTGDWILDNNIEILHQTTTVTPWLRVLEVIQ